MRITILLIASILFCRCAMFHESMRAKEKFEFVKSFEVDDISINELKRRVMYWLAENYGDAQRNSEIYETNLGFFYATVETKIKYNCKKGFNYGVLNYKLMIVADDYQAKIKAKDFVFKSQHNKGFKWLSVDRLKGKDVCAEESLKLMIKDIKKDVKERFETFQIVLTTDFMKKSEE